MLAPARGVVAVMVTGATAGTRPTGAGTRSSSTTPTQTATAVATPPSARLARPDRRIGAANRSGFSMKRRVSTASPPETRAAVSLAANPNGWPSIAGASTRTGQCHRYHEYEIRPTARIGDNPRTRPHPCDGVAQPAPITSAAPSVGNSAALPGYRVAGLKRVQATRITPSPDQPVIAAAPGDSRRPCPA